MTLIYESTFRCPECQADLRWAEITSAYIHNTVVFSDGFQVSSPSIMNRDEVLICPVCTSNFWKEEARVSDDMETNNNSDLPQAKIFSDLHQKEDDTFPVTHAVYFNQLIDEGFATSAEKEIYLRMQIWHLLNDMDRYPETQIFSGIKRSVIQRIGKEKNHLFTHNLKRLAAIFIPEVDEEKLLHAEMHRELGEFNKAMDLAGQISNREIEPFVKAIRKKVKAKKRKVFIIEDSTA